MVPGPENTYQTLRKDYPEFIFSDFDFLLEENKIEAAFHFSVPGLGDFSPEFRLESPVPFENSNKEAISNYIFHIGMIELISYWKAACPPRVVIRCGELDSYQVSFWTRLYYYGMGEFFYRNGIEVGEKDFVTLVSEGRYTCQPVEYKTGRSVMVPVGGGKDSAVTLGLLEKQDLEVMPFAINPTPAIDRTISASGLDGNTIIIRRSLDKKLLDLNARGFLNGHTPFSALLAFYSALTAYLTGISGVALSNESSANEATIPGTDINHQYSKSIDFENNFREYAHRCLSTSLNYFSFLRPLSELQIASLFASMKKFHPLFRSCNVGSKNDRWCGNCPKCLFTDIILSPFLSEAERNNIFGKDMLRDEKLVPVLDELAGIAENKPFECVGTIDEVRLALSSAYKFYPQEVRPYLLEHFRQQAGIESDRWDVALGDIGTRHNVPPDLLRILTNALER